MRLKKNKPLTFLFLFFITSFFFFSNIILVNAEPATIYVNVADDSGIPYENAKIYIRNMRTQDMVVGSVETDADGDGTVNFDLGTLPEFSFARPGDELNVIAVKGDFLGDKQTTVQVPVGLSKTWVNITSLDIISSPEPTSLKADVVNTTTVTLDWEADTSPYFYRYEVYLSRESDTIGVLHASITNPYVTTTNVSNLDPEVKYYFRVRTYDYTEKFADSNKVAKKTSGSFISLNPTIIGIMLVIVITIVVILALRFGRRDRPEPPKELRIQRKRK
jgi:hypothetical protein